MGRVQIRPPVKWHGGKHYLARRIVAQFAEHSTYVEPFGGCTSVLLNKPITEIEVYNDLDKRISRLFRVLRDRGDELQKVLSLTPYSEVEFNNSLVPSDDELEQTRRDFVR
ncbi:MAG: DNA adenine methylase [Planctomycetes bacterium]|nr:DNA adenine methylase [Planctomycetota bacterium]